MNNDIIKCEARINRLIEVDVQLYDVIDTINNLPNIQKWNYLGYIFNNMTLDLSDVNEEKRKIIKDFLIRQLSKFND